MELETMKQTKRVIEVWAQDWDIEERQTRLRDDWLKDGWKVTDVKPTAPYKHAYDVTLELIEEGDPPPGSQ